MREFNNILLRWIITGHLSRVPVAAPILAVTFTGQWLTAEIVEILQEKWMEVPASTKPGMTKKRSLSTVPISWSIRPWRSNVDNI